MAKTLACGVAACALFLAACSGSDESREHALANVSGVDLDTASHLAATSPSTPTAAAASEATVNQGVTETGAEQIAAQLTRDMEAFSALRDQPAGGVAQERDAAQGRQRDETGAAASRRVQFIERSGVNDPASTSSPTSSTASWSPERPFDAPSLPARSSDEAGSDAGVADLASPTKPTPAQRLQEAMVALRRELYQDASYADSPLRQYLVMAALTIVDPERAIDPEALHDLQPRERELLRLYQDFFRRMGEELAASSDEDAISRLLEELRQGLTNQGPLTIARAALCTSVEGFGRFEPFDKYAFLAGTAQQAVIYTEIEEFTSEQNVDGEWVTDLWQELVIYNSHDNVPVWYQEWQPASDVASRKRQDFYISHLITLPERLTIGQYTLKVRVKDAKSDAIAETGLEFSIVADPKLAATIPY